MSLKTLHRGPLLGTLLCAAALLTGCLTDPNPERRYEFPFQPPPTPVSGTTAEGFSPTPPTTAESDHSKLRVGDLIIVMFSDLVNPPPRQEINIPDGGEITLPYNVHVQAAGKSTSQLERDIRDAYVPGIFVNLTVTVRTEQRAFYVDGEVKTPGRHNYVGVMTLMRAIGTAGGFTEYANKKNIEIRRQGGQKYIINYKQALENSALDIPVYPNDLILVKRSVW